MANQVKSKKRVADHGEVFTAAREVNAMLDLVKTETERIDSRFLEPACGDGNFLAAILKRKLKEVKKKYHKFPADFETYSMLALTSIYGIDILDDNAKQCRERLYKIWEKDYKSICKNDVSEDVEKLMLSILNQNIVCGNALSMMCVDEKQQDTGHPIVFLDMKFDVIIGNPPYQQSDGGNGASAKPIYQLFVAQAKRLKPRFLTMIIPARWYAGGKGLDRFRKEMLEDRQLTQLHDYVNASDCFTGVEIKGGICYFLWENAKNEDCEVFTHKGDCVISTMKRPLLESGSKTFVRYNEAIKILRKIQSKNEATFDRLVSARKPFGLASNFREYDKDQGDSKKLYIYAQKDRGYVSKNQILKNIDWIDAWKVYIPEAIGAGNMERDVVRPIVDGPGTVCSETYVVVGPMDEETARNIESYVKTKFFHFMLGLKKITQHTTSKTYSFVPVQDFSVSWDDALLYKKYELSKQEIKFIEESVWPQKNAQDVYKPKKSKSK